MIQRSAGGSRAPSGTTAALQPENRHRVSQSSASLRSRVAGEVKAERGCLLIADISGYTDYVMESPLEYAEDVVSDVTATVVQELRPILRVNKLEGDAVFAYALEGEIDASMLVDGIEQSYFAFRNRLRGIEHSTSCTCNACAKIPDLNLKFVAHYGSFIRRPATGGEELTGQDVIVVHRLLKNTVGETFGLRGYALFTEACIAALGLDPAAAAMAEHGESYRDVGGVRVYVQNLEARWEKERHRRPVFVPRGEAGFEIEVLVPAEPAVVWEYLTSPAKRALWQGEGLEIEEVAPAGRRGVDTTRFCVDGRTTVYEEILDWRPFHYFTEGKTLPGPVRLVLTTELEPAAEGTLVRVRAARPEGRARLAWLVVGPRFRRELRGRHERLAGLLQAGARISRPLPFAVR